MIKSFDEMSYSELIQYLTENSDVLTSTEKEILQSIIDNMQHMLKQLVVEAPKIDH